jgi:hypothetical protein
MRTRRFLVDTGVMVVFTTIVGLCVEAVICGIPWRNIVKIRLLSIVANLVTARAYGLYRDWVFKKTRMQTRGRLQRIGIDTVAFFTFQNPVYFVLLCLGGASVVQALKACVAGFVTVLVLGRPYGIFLDWIRRKFGTHV